MISVQSLARCGVLGSEVTNRQRAVFLGYLRSTAEEPQAFGISVQNLAPTMSSVLRAVLDADDKARAKGSPRIAAVFEAEDSRARAEGKRSASASSSPTPALGPPSPAPKKDAEEGEEEEPKKDAEEGEEEEPLALALEEDEEEEDEEEEDEESLPRGQGHRISAR